MEKLNYSRTWITQHAGGETSKPVLIDGCCVYHAINNFNKKENGSVHLLKFRCKKK